jgi:hypothetical protein
MRKIESSGAYFIITGTNLTAVINVINRDKSGMFFGAVPRYAQIGTSPEKIALSIHPKAVDRVDQIANFLIGKFGPGEGKDIFCDVIKLK